MCAYIHSQPPAKLQSQVHHIKSPNNHKIYGRQALHRPTDVTLELWLHPRAFFSLKFCRLYSKLFARHVTANCITCYHSSQSQLQNIEKYVHDFS